jgi:hypothetical protein
VALVAASFLACLGAPRWAHADDASCIAASESEVGLRKQDKLIESLVQLALCAAPACPIEVRSECNRRLVRVNTAMPTLVLRATDDAGNDLLAVTVSLDGAPFATSLTGRATSLNPGSHVLRFEARGKVPLEKTLLVAQGEKDRRIVVTLLDAHAAAPVVVAPAPSPSVAPVPPRPVVPVSPIETPEPPPTSHGDGRRTAAYVLGGVGLGGIVAGGVFGGLAFSKWSSATGAECSSASTHSCTNSNAQGLGQTAGTFADVSTIALIAGGALLATGAVLVLTAPPKNPTTGLHVSPTLLAHGGGVGLSGAW